MMPVLVPVFPPNRYKSLKSFTIIVLQNKLVQTDTNLCKPVKQSYVAAFANSETTLLC